MSTVTLMAKKRRLLDSGQYEKLGELVRKVMLPHEVYAEPFFLEGEVLLAKNPSPVEVIGDMDGRIVEFYMTVRIHWRELAFLLESTLYADTLYCLADRIASGEVRASAVYRAWSVWLRYNRQRESKDAWLNHTSAWMDGVRPSGSSDTWLEHLASRLRDVHITEARPADIIREVDSPDTFFYICPHTLKEVKEVEEVMGGICGSYVFHYTDKRVMERIAMKFGLTRETDDMGNTVYTSYKRQKTLFENL